MMCLERSMFHSPSKNNNFMPILYVNEYDELSNTYTFESSELSLYAENGNWSMAMIGIFSVIVTLNS